ncbi:hypothetical protein [Spirosoma pollinicola]|nr:hypothetical protein [Spirosoma pollinicola]
MKTDFGGEDWSAYPATLVFDDQVPKLNYILPVEAQGSVQQNTDNKLWGAPLYAATENGETFFSKLTYYSDSTTEYGGPNKGFRVNLESLYWQLFQDEIFLWVGQLSEKIPFSRGNLRLEVENFSASQGHYYLKGDIYTYYILRQKDTNLFVIEAPSAILNHAIVDRDLWGISFCLGFPITCKLLTGFNREGKIIGYAGSNFGFNKIKKNSQRPPIPYKQNVFCLPELFEKITQKLSEVAKKDNATNYLLDVLWLYVESTAETWNTSRELKLFYACLNAAICIVYSNLDGLKNNESKVRDVEELLTQFTDKQSTGLSSLQPIRIFQVAASFANIENVTDLIQSARMSYSALMNGQPEDLEASKERQDKLINLCIALLAHYVGYTGPIYNGLPQPIIPLPTYEMTDSTLETYIAHTANLMPLEEITNLWPVFQEPTIPKNSLVGLVNNFAKSLAPRTENRVRARLVPLPSFGQDQPKLFDFIIESTRYTLASNILFTIRQISNTAPLEITNWDEDVPTIATEQQLIPFLTSVASSERTKELIERLLLAIPNE